MAKPSKPSPTSVRFPDDIKKRLQQVADEEHRTFTNMVEKIVIDYLDERDQLRGRKKRPQ